MICNIDHTALLAKEYHHLHSIYKQLLPSINFIKTLSSTPQSIGISLFSQILNFKFQIYKNIRKKKASNNLPEQKQKAFTI